MTLYKRLAHFITSILLLGLVVYFVEPPRTWADASILQILVFLIPALMFFTTTLNIFLNNYYRSIPVGLGLLVLLVLQSVSKLNPASLIVTVALTIILALYFKKTRLTRVTNIPKLTRQRR